VRERRYLEKFGDFTALAQIERIFETIDDYLKIERMFEKVQPFTLYPNLCDSSDRTDSCALPVFFGKQYLRLMKKLRMIVSSRGSQTPMEHALR
jgi:hypothetical protein